MLLVIRMHATSNLNAWQHPSVYRGSILRKFLPAHIDLLNLAVAFVSACVGSCITHMHHTGLILTNPHTPRPPPPLPRLGLSVPPAAAAA